MTGRALALFKGEFPHTGRSYDVIIAPRALESAVRTAGASFEALEDFVDPGSIEEAAQLLGELARATFPDGTRVSRSRMYKGYELWWFSYDELFYRECLPYTQYQRLFERLRDFSHVEVHHASVAGLLHCYLDAYGVRHTFHGKPRSFPSLGIWLQAFVSLISLPLLMLKRPGILLYTGDRFDPPRDHSFRLRLVYEELRARKLPFAEFIRSLEPARTMFAHALKRRRPVIYSYALKVVLAWFSSLAGEHKLEARLPEPERQFRLALAATYLPRARAHAWMIALMHRIVRLVGFRAAFIAAASSRTFHEVIACKLARVPTVGILHGAASRYYNVYDFMPEYDGKARLGVDSYGVWSEGWKHYYLEHGRMYGAEQLPVSGPIRPLQGLERPAASRDAQADPVKVLFVAGELSAPEEVLPYMRALMQTKGVSFYLTFRPYRDAFEAWLKEHEPELLQSIPPERIFRGRRIQEDIADCDVVVGSYSTAVLEALLQLKPAIFYRTKKWGDYFGMKEEGSMFFAENPEELVERVRKSRDIPAQELKRLQERFFGDPQKNGSAWVVDELEKML